MRQRLTLTVLLVSTTLGACGTRGPLTLPPPQSKTDFSEHAGARPSTQVLSSIDLNTAKVPS
jgi:predicted small lipoprotein YifL